MPQRFRFVLANTSTAGKQIAGALIGVVLGLSSLAPPLAAQVPFSDAVQVATGAAHTCALEANGDIRCWGSNTDGQLGDGTTTQRLTGVLVNGLSDVTTIAAAGNHTCATTTSGKAYCWGSNSSGQLGDDSTTNRHTAIAVSGLDLPVSAIAAGASHTCAVSGGDVHCWGNNYYGQLGDGTTKSGGLKNQVQHV